MSNERTTRSSQQLRATKNSDTQKAAPRAHLCELAGAEHLRARREKFLVGFSREDVVDPCERILLHSAIGLDLVEDLLQHQHQAARLVGIAEGRVQTPLLISRQHLHFLFRHERIGTNVLIPADSAKGGYGGIAIHSHKPSDLVQGSHGNGWPPYLT